MKGKVAEGKHKMSVFKLLLEITVIFYLGSSKVRE